MPPSPRTPPRRNQNPRQPDDASVRLPGGSVEARRWGWVCHRQVVPSRPPQVRTREVVPRPVPGGGSRLSLRESPDAKSRGGMPPAPPGFRGRSFPLARFGGCGASFRWMGYSEPHVRALIWELSFAKMLSSIFPLENASQIGLSIPEEIAPRPLQRQLEQKSASGNERS